MIGWALSFYFDGVRRGRLQSDLKWIPAVCRISEGECRSIAETSYGRIGGVPNALSGQAVYGLLFLLAAGRSLFGAVVDPWIRALSIVLILASLYLLWGLYRLRVLCSACLAAHAANGLIFLLSHFGS